MTTSSTNYTSNIYSADGVLGGNRTVDLNGNNLYFNGTGNVGIGTTNVNVKLRVNGQVRATSFRSANGTAGSPAYRFDSDTNTGIFRPGADQLAFTTGGIERIRVDNSGNVGIGVLVPTEKLDVAGNLNISSGSTYKINGNDLAINDLADVDTSTNAPNNGQILS